MSPKLFIIVYPFHCNQLLFCKLLTARINIHDLRNRKVTRRCLSRSLAPVNLLCLSSISDKTLFHRAFKFSMSALSFCVDCSAEALRSRSCPAWFMYSRLPARSFNSLRISWQWQHPRNDRHLKQTRSHRRPRLVPDPNLFVVSQTKSNKHQTLF